MILASICLLIFARSITALSGYQAHQSKAYYHFYLSKNQNLVTQQLFSIWPMIKLIRQLANNVVMQKHS